MSLPGVPHNFLSWRPLRLHISSQSPSLAHPAFRLISSNWLNGAFFGLIVLQFAKWFKYSRKTEKLFISSVVVSRVHSPRGSGALRCNKLTFSARYTVSRR